MFYRLVCRTLLSTAAVETWSAQGLPEAGHAYQKPVGDLVHVSERGA
jgi:hypothetical protein